MEIQSKGKAIKLLQKLKIYKPYIEEFKDKNRVCFFEGYGGFWVDQEKDIYNKMKEIESKYNCLVYAITHEYTDFGECYDFLILPEDDKDSWDNLITSYNGNFCTFAYTWNVDNDDCSEIGDVILNSWGGGIMRVN